MANKNKIDTIERPMSPHLQVYKISFTMIMSMMHRISGFILYLGSFLFLVWYLSIFFCQDAYSFVNLLFSLSFLKLAIFLFIPFPLYSGITYINPKKINLSGILYVLFSLINA